MYKYTRDIQLYTSVVYYRICMLVANYSAHCSPLRCEGSAEDYSYPYNYNNSPTEMVKNPAYVTMETGQIVRSQNDEGNVTDHAYATVGMEEDNTEASAITDEYTL